MDRKLTMRELHEAQLNMLKEFHDFCKTNGITYFLAFGTLIGAVRHNGFIPWDDDVDVIVPRPDFEKLISLQKMNERYDIVSNKYFGVYNHPFLHANITDKYTYMDEHDMITSTGKGVFLDIFPLDGLPRNSFLIKIHCKKLQIMKALLGYSISNPKKKQVTCFTDRIKRCIRFLCRRLIIPKCMINSIQKKASKYDYESSKYVAVSSSMPSVLPYYHFVFEKELYKPITHEFEGIKLIIPSGYDHILTSLYGDYMTPPPVEKRQQQHDIDYYWKDK